MTIFNELLIEFKTILSTETEKNEIVRKIEALKIKGSQIQGNDRQSDAIMSRCTYYLAGRTFTFIDNGNMKSYNVNNL